MSDTKLSPFQIDQRALAAKQNEDTVTIPKCCYVCDFDNGRNICDTLGGYKGQNWADIRGWVNPCSHFQLKNELSG